MALWATRRGRTGIPALRRIQRNRVPRSRLASLLGERGQAMVEMALLTPILLLIIAGIVESGRFFLVYVQLSNAAREGVRVGSFTPRDTSTIQAAVRRELPSWLSAEVTTPNISIYCTSSSSSSFTQGCGSGAGEWNPASGDKVQVQASFGYEPIMPVVGGLSTFVSFTMTGSAVMRVQ